MTRERRKPRALAALIATLVFVGVACGGDETGEVDNSCGARDGEPNNNATQATPHALGAAFEGCLAGADVDHFSIVAPQDQTGGQVQVSIGDVAGGTVRVRVYDGAGATELASMVAPGAGDALTFFLAIAPSRDARIAISNADAAAQPYTYKLTTTYQPVPDMFEPNDSESAAATMQVGGFLQAYLFAGAGEGPAAYDDNYRFNSFADTVTIKVEDVPADLAARLFLFRPDGTEVARVSAGLKGGVLTMRPPVPLDPGHHLIRVSVWDPPSAVAEGASPPDHFTRAYKLTVTQP